MKNTLKINLKKLKRNLLKIRKKTGRKILLPVKANAYGHGLLTVSKYVQEEKLVDFLGLAFLREADILIKNKIKLPILIFFHSKYNKEDFDFLSENKNLIQVISDFDFLKKLSLEMKKREKRIEVHLMIDTGMGRCGFLPTDFKKALNFLKKDKSLVLKGVSTHFSMSGGDSLKEKKYTANQLKKFEESIKGLEKKDILFHIANSAFSLKNENLFDMVRTGISAYGYENYSTNLDLEEVAELESEVILIKKYPKNFLIGYDGLYKIKKENQKVALISIGYADGIPLALSGKIEVLINGKRYDSIGRINMDGTMVLVDDKVKVGDKVKIFGKSKKSKIFLKNLADKYQGSVYELIISFSNSKRVCKKYIF